MRKVAVTYYGLLQHIVGNRENEYSISSDATVSDLLHLLVERYGKNFRANILTPDWQLQPLAVIQLNGRNINEIDGLDTVLVDNSELSIAIIAYLVGGG